MLKQSIRFITGICAVLLTGCAAKFDPATAYSDKTAQQIFHDGEKNLKKGDYTDAVQHFETYDARYPFEEHIEQVQLDIIYAYYQKEDLAASLTAADRFIHLHPTSSRVDYAYYMRGLSNYLANIGTLDKHMPIDFAQRDLTSAKKAFLDFAELTHRFPHSVYAPDAIQRMIFLRNILALHEYEAARYYFKTEAYIAAANRCYDLLQHYQGAPIIPQAAALLIASYQKLGLYDLANETAQLMEFNQQEIPAVEEKSN